MENALRQIDGISDSISSRLVSSESWKMKTTNLSISLKKVASGGENGLNLEDGLAQFTLPNDVNLSTTDDINAKVGRLVGGR